MFSGYTESETLIEPGALAFQATIPKMVAHGHRDPLMYSVRHLAVGEPPDS